MTAIRLIYPHQLFERSLTKKNTSRVYLIEDPLFFPQYAFHRQKLMLHRASMKRLEANLVKQSIDVRYIEATQLTRSNDIAKILHKDRVKAVNIFDVEDNYLQRRLLNGCQQHSIKVTIEPDPHFLTSISDIDSFVAGKQKLFFTNFYIEQRKRTGYLIDDDGKAVGGKWSFDTENRKKLPKDIELPAIALPKEDTFAKEARQYIQSNFPNAIGDDESLRYPSSRTAALKWLDTFIEQRLALFGDYEDAIATDESILFHSCLTPMLNTGLLSPQEVVDRAIEAEDVSINSLEGFVRQVIGWREFIRLVYRKHGVLQRTTNYWKHHRKIPSSFYDGTTGIEPIDTVIRRVLATGYCHHIERLMILGNFMLLCELDPDDVYRWFMELFIDAYDWVMVPNIYGMSQHADGGLMTTKPYISGSSYVLRMSNFKKGPWCETWDGLYWQFVYKHRDFFEKNPRMSVMTSQLDKMGTKLKTHISNAENFLSQLK
jgi:deoxyribodipyrimidine photolyase-related protein